MKPFDLQFEHRNDGWYIVNVWTYYIDGERCDCYGPYDTKLEVREAMRAVARTMQEILDEDLYIETKERQPAAVVVVAAQTEARPAQLLALVFQGAA
jgi:hypothetical protein